VPNAPTRGSVASSVVLTNATPTMVPLKVTLPWALMMPGMPSKWMKWLS
jgi:hypothetical protein